MKNENLLKRFYFASNGILHGFRTESSFRFQFLATLGAIGTLFLIRPEPIWWALIFLTCASVLAAELLNTALELFIDTVHPEKKNQIGWAKDCAAGAVWILSLSSMGIFGALLFNFFKDRL